MLIKPSENNFGRPTKPTSVNNLCITIIFYLYRLCNKLKTCQNLPFEEKVIAHMRIRTRILYARHNKPANNRLEGLSNILLMIINSKTKYQSYPTCPFHK